MARPWQEVYTTQRKHVLGDSLIIIIEKSAGAGGSWPNAPVGSACRRRGASDSARQARFRKADGAGGERGPGRPSGSWLPARRGLARTSSLANLAARACGLGWRWWEGGVHRGAQDCAGAWAQRRAHRPGECGSCAHRWARGSTALARIPGREEGREREGYFHVSAQGAEQQ
jgi:hypothetical protein